ncbi:MAG TPA: RNA polymerase subunit sigma-70 [Kofleriaceae bacterium]|jgi:RNA polymerase sigma-70 factor (ECF subfamily)|nr:RNA polymerase subunit sigma-70 [Kofleriaceae bacterium]
MDREQAAFAAQCEPHRRALRVHCYRMVGSSDEAEDLVQETFLRAWRSRATFEGRAQLSTWLHRIATNACLDALARRPRRVLPQDVVPAVRPTDEPRATPPLRPELPWLQPFPDALLDAPAPGEAQPEALVAARETIELAFLAAVQHLEPRPRAILILCDVLGWSAKETAGLLELTVPAVTSALQRAHATMRTLVPTGRDGWTPAAPPSDDERAVLAAYMAAWERHDASELTRLLRDDARWAMPPAALWFDGRSAIERLFTEFPMDFHGHFRMVATAANRQPAAATYMRPHGQTEFRFSGIQVLRIERGQIAEITSFSAALCRTFELPMIFSEPPV